MYVSSLWRPYVLLNEIFAHSAKMYLNKSHKTFLSCWPFSHAESTKTQKLHLLCFMPIFDDIVGFRVLTALSSELPQARRNDPNGHNGAVEHKTFLSCWEKAPKHKSYTLTWLFVFYSLSVPLVRIVTYKNSNLFSATPSQLFKRMNWNIQAHLNAWGLKPSNYILCAPLPVWFWRI